MMDLLTYKPSQFVGFLPYFCMSKSAFELVAFQNNNPAPYIDFSPVLTMEERIGLCETAHATNIARMQKLTRRGYLTETLLKYGESHWKSFRAFRMTDSTLHALLGIVDQKTEKARIKICQSNNRTSVSPFTAVQKEENKQLLIALDKLRQEEWKRNKKPLEMNKARDEFIRELLSRDCITLLGSVDPRNLSLATMSECYTGHQLYKLWRLSNAEALFRANGFLTSLDRRPYDAVWRFKDSKTITDKATMPVHESFGSRMAYVPEVTLPGQKKEIEWKNKKNKKTLLDYCQSTLKTWYKKHPQSFFFSDPFAPMDAVDLGQWSITPAFYPAFDIPGFGGEINVETNMISSGANNVLHYNFIGLAVGTNNNYLVYHTRPKRTNWSESTERSTALAVQLALDKSGKKEGLNGAGREINYALMICMTPDQFVTLFKTEAEKIPKRWRSALRVGAPFDSVHIITVNNAGAMLLRGLMLTSPAQYEDLLVNSIATENPELFSKIPDPHYRLAYDNTPVLVAHSMNFATLYRAWEDHRNGRKFYVSCYPEQVRFLRELLPGVEFL